MNYNLLFIRLYLGIIMETVVVTTNPDLDYNDIIPTQNQENVDVNTNIDTDPDSYMEMMRMNIQKLKTTMDKMIPALTEEMNDEIKKDTDKIDQIQNNESIQKQDKDFIVSSFNDSIDRTKKYYQDKIDSLKTELTEKEKFLADEEKRGLGKHWDDANNMTLSNWIKECHKQQYIYESVLDSIISKSKKIKIALLVLSAINTIVSVATFAVTDQSSIYLQWTVKIVTALIAGVTYILTQVMTIEKYEDIIKTYTIYSDEIEKFLSNLISTADVKLSLRPDGDQFILENKTAYAKLYRDSPHIAQSAWKASNVEYLKYLDKLNDEEKFMKTRKRRAFDDFIPVDSTPQTKVSTHVSNIQGNNMTNVAENADVKIDITDPSFYTEPDKVHNAYARRITKNTFGSKRGTKIFGKV